MEKTSYAPGTPSWVDLSSPDVAASAQFYAQLFGWEIDEPQAQTGGYRTARLRGKSVAGIAPLPGSQARPMWLTHITVLDAEATGAAIRQAGGSVVTRPMQVLQEGRLATYRDTTGAVFQVWQPMGHDGAELVNEHGTLCWNELNTREPQVAAEFYQSVFGWDDQGSEGGGAGYWSWLLDGEAIAGMIAMDENWPAESPSNWAVYFAVDDLDASMARVQDLGGQVNVGPRTVPVGTWAMISDPQGATLFVIQLAAQP